MITNPEDFSESAQYHQIPAYSVTEHNAISFSKGEIK